MALFARQPERRPGRVLVASGARIDLSDRKVAARARNYRQGWQAEAHGFRDSIGELRYAHDYLGNACSRMRLFAAAYDPKDPTAPPVPVAETKAVSAELAAAATAAIERLGAGRLATAALLNPLAVNLEIAGECYLVGRQDPTYGWETWQIRSVDEVLATDDGYRLRELPGDFTDSQAMKGELLKPETTYVARLWKPHPRFRVLADSPMRAILELCDELLLLSRGIRAAAKSRMAANGLLYVADELTLTQAEEPDDNPLADPFMALLTQAMTAPILDEGAPSAVVPIVVRGPADLAQSLVHIPLDRLVDKTAMETRAELIRRIATGIDLPPEILLGMGDVNHWSSYQISDETFKAHIEPKVLTQVDALTEGFLWPALAAEGFKPDEFRQVVIWYDPTEIVTHPDRTADALQLWDRFAISDAALRQSAGFGDNDRPAGLELVQRLVSHARSFPPNVLEAIIHRLDPSLEIPADRSEPGYGPGGELEEPEDAAPADGQPEVGPPPMPKRDGAPPAGKGAPAGPAAPARASVRPLRVLTASVAPAAPHRAGIQLADADRDLLIRLHTAADSEMRRALEKAGARMRTKVRASSGHAATIKDVSNVAVCATLGATVVTAAGGGQDPSWADLATHWAEWVAGAQAFARGRVQRLVGDLCQVGQARIGRCAVSEQDLASLAAEQVRHAAEGWRALEASLTALFRRLLYSPAPAPVLLPGEPGPVVGGTGPLVPLQVVRESLALAGGGHAGNVAQGLAVGADVLGLLGEFGVTPSGYEWRHGQSGGEPFEPHAVLDGLVVSGPEDPRLLNTYGFPDSDYLWPGDHVGCACQARALFGTGVLLGQAA